MKKQMLIHIFAFILVDCYCQNIQKSDGPTNSGQYTFSLVGASPYPLAVTQIGYYWNFGDGNYEYGLNPTHIYTSSIPPGQNVYVEVTALSGYTDTDIPKRIYYDANNDITDGYTPPSITPLISASAKVAGQTISIEANRRLVPGHIVTYVVKYKLDGCEKDPRIRISFPAELIPENSSQLPPISLYTDPSFKIDVANSYQRYRYIYFRMKIAETAQIGTTLSVTASIEGSKNFVYSDCESYTDVREIKASHDPNLMEGDFDYICKSPDSNRMKYTIVFQNTGTFEATNVKVMNFIPDYFDLNTINVLDPIGLVPTSITGRAITWDIWGNNLKNNGRLYGTNQSQNSVPFQLHQTIDTLVYEIDLKSSSLLRDCDVIVNRAEITFDNHPPIWTAPFMTYFDCHPDTISCDSCHEFKILECMEMPLKRNFLGCSILTFDESQLQHPPYDYFWYPSYGLDNPSSKNPKACPCEDTDYYLVVTGVNFCERFLFQCPIHVESVPCFLSRPWSWWLNWLTGILFAIIVFYFLQKYFKKKSVHVS